MLIFKQSKSDDSLCEEMGVESWKLHGYIICYKIQIAHRLKELQKLYLIYLEDSFLMGVYI